jgi:hypothetical protein
MKLGTNEIGDMKLGTDGTFPQKAGSDRTFSVWHRMSGAKIVNVPSVPRFPVPHFPPALIIIASRVDLFCAELRDHVHGPERLQRQCVQGKFHS